MTLQIERRRFTVTDYARMRESGILAEDDRVELIDGEVRLMSPIGPRHAAIVNRLGTLIRRYLDETTAIVSIQNPIQLNNYAEPQPDIALLNPRDDYYAQAHPRPDDVLLIIEVADTSLAYDREGKLPDYAEAGISEAWLVDINGQTVEQYSQPRNGQYRNKLIISNDEVIVSLALPQLQLAINDMFI